MINYKQISKKPFMNKVSSSEYIWLRIREQEFSLYSKVSSLTLVIFTIVAWKSAERKISTKKVNEGQIAETTSESEIKMVLCKSS